MAKFAEEYPDVEFVQTVSAQIPWSHNVLIMEKTKAPEIREWYIRKTNEHGWSHSVLTHQIESKLYERQALVSKVSNYEKLLPSAQGELALETMKDPYVFFYLSAVDAQIKKPEAGYDPPKNV